MTRLWLVRHGEPVGGQHDPPLTRLGHEQSEAVGERLVALDPCAVVSSPLVRACETAAPLARRWGVEIEIVDAVRELPSESYEPEARQAWLRMAMRSTFAELDVMQRSWRDGIIAFLLSRREPAVIFSHAVVINAVVGRIEGHDRVLAFVPEHTSVTVVDSDGSQLTLVERGAGRAQGPLV